MTRRARFLLVLALLSGATSLLYQVVWSRLLTLHIGLTAAAISTVLAAFMGGLALGALAARRRAEAAAPRRALRLYAGLEAATGLAALGVAPALSLTHPLLATAYRDGDGGFLFALLRLLICLVIVTLPATLMGATVPFAVRALERKDVHASRTAGLFYAMSTLGAAIGAAVTGFVVIPALGLQRATLVGAGLNLIVALGAGWLSLRAGREGEQVAESASRGTRRSGGGALGSNDWSSRARPGSAAITLAISGFVALVHEVAWTRVIALTLGPTTYAFSTMLTTCILGLAVGAAIATRVLPRLRRPATALALTQIFAAIGAFIAAALVPRLPGLVASIVNPPHALGWTIMTESLLIAALLLPMTIALGAAFPFGVAAALRSPHAARNGTVDTEAVRETSLLYTANTAGAIGGALAGGFVFIPQLGLQRTIIFAGLIGVLAGVELIWRTRRRGHARIWLPLVGLLAAAFGIAMPQWNPAQLVRGAYRQRDASAPDVRNNLDAGALLYYDDGAAGTVSVRRLAGTIGLSINGAVDASNADDMLRQMLLAHLPLLLHDAPSDVCIIGLGSGVTAGAALAHPIDRVDTIELSREVVRASDFFSTENRAALRDQRHHLTVGDGRTHLRLSRRTYDVILSEPSSPWVAGTGPLFTRELFTAARDRLNAGGLFGQRLHLRDLDRDDLASLLATFTAVFPHATVWMMGDADLIAIGSTQPLTPRIEQLARRWQVPGIAADLERVHVHDPFALLQSFVMDETTIKTLASGAPLQTDDTTRLEFSGFSVLQQRDAQRDREREAWLSDARVAPARPAVVREAEAHATGPQWRDRALMLLGAGAASAAYDAAARALTFDPTDPDSLSLITKTSEMLGRPADGLALLDQMRARAPDSLTPLIELSRLRAIAGDADGAVDAATAATRRFPDAFESWQQLATLFADRRDETNLAQTFESMHAQFPDRWETRYFEATLALLRGEVTVAVNLGEQVLKERASDPRTLSLLGAAYARLGIHARARDALEARIQSNPRDPDSYVQLARLELDTFNPPRAAALFSEALVLNPRLPAALRGLADALSKMGRADRAAELRARAGS